MTAGNIAPEEATARASLLAVQLYEIHLDVTLESGPHRGTQRRFGTTTSVWFRCAQPGASTWIDLIVPRVHSITLNGRRLDPAEVYDGHRIVLRDLPAENELHVEAEGEYSDSSEGLHRFVDPVDDAVYLYTQCQPADARRIFAVFDQPNLRAPYRLSVTAPEPWLVASNALVEQVSDDGPTRRWTFGATKSLPSYLVEVIAGPYHVVRGTHEAALGRLPLAVYCRASLAAQLDAAAVLDLTRAGLDFFEECFATPYPFEQYATAFVPEFEGDAMEHPGLVTCGEECLIGGDATDELREHVTDTLLHEMSHMWFGDLVTIAWWDDLWLNESFAEWAAHHATSRCTPYVDAWASFTTRGKVLTGAEDRFPGGRVWATWADQLPTTHPIAPPPGDLDTLVANFDGVTYSKGGSVLRQLVALLGEETFVKGVREHFRRHAWGAASSADFLGALESVAGRDLGEWAQGWLRTEGMNLLRGEFTAGAGELIGSFRVLQEAPSAPVGAPQLLREHRTELGCFALSEGVLARTATLRVPITGALTEVADLAGHPHPGLLLVNDRDLSFARIRLDPVSFETAARHLGSLPEPLARAQLWAMFWDLTRDGEMAISRFIDIAVAGLPGERHVGSMLETVRRLRVGIAQYAAPGAGAALSEQLGGALLEILETEAALAAAGGQASPSRARAACQGFAAVAQGAVQLDVLQELLRGPRERPALVVDADLRRRIVQRLAATGRIDRTQIEVELRGDSSVAGRRSADTALAALPTATAKQWAWERILGSGPLSQSDVLALTLGLAQTPHPGLHADLVEQLPEALPVVWERRSFKVASLATVGLLSALSPTPRLLEVVDALAEDPGLPAQALRLVIEGRDDIARAIRGQAVDARHRQG